MCITVKTCRRPYWFLNWGDLTPKEQTKFDWLDTEDARWAASFIRYRGWVYSMDQFMRIARGMDGLAQWDGYHSDSAFSGVVIKLSGDGDSAIMGTYFS